MPTESKELLRIISELASIIADMLGFVREDKREEFRNRYLDIMGDKDK